MNKTTTNRYIQHQQRIFRYVLLIMGVSVCATSFGVYHMFSSSRTAYEVQDLSREISNLSLDIAQEESRYYEATKDIVQSDVSTSMVAYSPSSEDLRYAQVGGAVYTFASARNR